jgi:hypothetical protein
VNAKEIERGLHTSLLTESWRRIRALMNSRVLAPGSRVRLTQSQESSGRSSNCTMQLVVIPPNGWRLHLNLGRILWIAAALECFSNFPSVRLRDRDCEIPMPSPAKSRPASTSSPVSFWTGAPIRRYSCPSLEVHW